MVIHGSLLEAVQSHADPAVTATEPIPPAAGAGALAGAVE
jgi:hypothetical protein